MHYKQKRWQFARPAPDLTPLPPNCHPTVFGEILFGDGGRDAGQFGQFVDIQLFCVVMHPGFHKKRSLEKGSFVRIKGLEPPRLSASDPKSDVATNYTISACCLISATCPPDTASRRLRVRPASTSRQHLFYRRRRICFAPTSRPPGICFTSAFPTVRPASASPRHLVRPASASRPPLTGPVDKSSVCGNHVTNQRKVNKNNTSTRSVRIKNWVFAFFLVTFVTN